MGDFVCNSVIARSSPQANDEAILSVMGFGEKIALRRKFSNHFYSELVPIMKYLYTFFVFVPALLFAQSTKNMPLVEYFTNTSCTNCPAYTNSLDAALSSVGRSNVAVILYHNADPSPTDPFYEDNTAESNARSTYYSVQGDPDIFVESQNVSSNSYIQTALQSELNQTSTLQFTLGGMLQGRSGAVNVQVAGSAPGSWKLFAVITETGLTYHGSNGEVVHNDVFRKTLTTWNGVGASSGGASLPFTLGYDDNINPNDSVPWNLDSCRVVVWAQNVATKAIYQSAQIWVSALQQPSAFAFSSPDTNLCLPPVADDIEAVGYIYNTSSNTMNVTGVRLIDSLPNANWSTSVCLAVCGAPTVDTESSTPLSPGGVQQFLLHFDPNTTPGAASITMKFYDASNPSDSIIKHFHFRTNAPTQFLGQTSGQTITTDNDTVRWKTDLTGMAALYFTINDSTWNFLDSVNLASDMYIWQLQGITAYNLRLQIPTTEGNVRSSSFSLVPSAVAEPKLAAYALNCTPNPANTSLSISLPAYDTRRISLFDALGRMVYDHSFTGGEPSANVVIPTAALPAGMYYARALAPAGEVQKPVLIVH